MALYNQKIYKHSLTDALWYHMLFISSTSFLFSDMEGWLTHVSLRLEICHASAISLVVWLGLACKTSVWLNKVLHEPNEQHAQCNAKCISGLPLNCLGALSISHSSIGLFDRHNSAHNWRKSYTLHFFCIRPPGHVLTISFILFSYMLFAAGHTPPTLFFAENIYLDIVLSCHFLMFMREFMHVRGCRNFICLLAFFIFLSGFHFI